MRTYGCILWGCLVATLLLVTTAAASGCDAPRRSSSSSSSESSSDEERAFHAEIPTDQSASGTTRRGTYYVEITPDPNPIPFQELFEFRARIYTPGDRNAPLENTRLDQVRAVMPAHDHGMKTDPTWEEIEPGVFRIRGMKFHMQGAGKEGLWVVHLLVGGPEGVDEATFDLQCCRPGHEGGSRVE